MERKTERTVIYSLGTGIHQYDKPFPNYSRPVEFGHFSVEAGQLKNDRSQLRTFVPPDDWNNCSFNLRDGYENMIDEDEDVDPEEKLRDVGEDVDPEEKMRDKGEDVDPEEKLRDVGEDVDPEEKLRDKGEDVDPEEKLRDVGEDVDPEEKLRDKGEDVDPEEKLRDKGEDVDPEEKLRDVGEDMDPEEKLRDKGGDVDPEEKLRDEGEDVDPEEKLRDKGEDVDPEEKLRDVGEDMDPEEKLRDKGEDVDPEEKLRDKGEDVDPEEKLRDKGEDVDPDEKLSYFTWIMQNRDKFISTPSTHPPAEGAQTNVETNDGLLHSLNVDFVCGRALLTKLLCTPYERIEDIGIIVMRFRGTFFMLGYETELRRTQIEQLNIQRPWEKYAEKAKETQEEPVETPEERVERPDYDEICYWGVKFEQYVTAEAGSEVPDTHSPVIRNREFEIVLRSKLGPHSLMFFVEVDCEDKNCTEGSKYVELKTSRLIESEKQYKNFCRYKLLKWWAQSFVGGVPRVVCGFRDDYGVVRKLEEFQVLKMPHMASSSVHHPWKPAVCFNFLSAFLDFVKSVIDEERCVYVFHRKPDSDMICMKVDEIPYYAFFPEKFIKWDAWDKPCLPEDSATDLFLPAFVQIPKNP